jgi:hypothetical protein
LEIKHSINQIKHTVESHSRRLEQVENRISGHETKINVIEKADEYTEIRLKGMYKNSATPSKHETCESWVSKKEKMHKQRHRKYMQQNNSRKLPIS